jgi:hypothetical protein
MTMTRLISVAVLLCLLAAMPAVAQQSDLTIKKNFEERYKFLSERVDSAKTITDLDTLKTLIDSLQNEFASKDAFLDRVLYPETYADKMNTLRGRHILTYDRVQLIRTYGVRISELEARIYALSARIDSLTTSRDQLFSELQEARKNVQTLREAVKRLTANLSLKDKLIFALVDSIFLPYDKNLTQVSEMQKEAISRKLEKANVVTRVYEFAADNVKFLEVTQLQAKDYANLIDQYQQFKARWDGLSDKMNAVAVASPQPSAAPATGTGAPTIGRTTVKRPGSPPRAQVDSVIVEWNKKLQAAFWAGLQHEFTLKQLTVLPFTDAAGFSSSVRAYVEAVKQSGQDASVFADEVWKGRIDKEWREALSKETMLGKTEYAALDKLVSELSKEKVDLRFILYIAIIIVIAVAVWWFFIRKSRPKEPVQPKSA